MKTEEEYPMGREIRFQHGVETLTGTVNGEVIEMGQDEGDFYEMIPVYVRENDRCIAVDSRNILEGE